MAEIQNCLSRPGVRHSTAIHPRFLGYTESDVAEAKQYESDRRNRNKSDQAMRYHTDSEGHEWLDAHAVMPDSYPDEIAELRYRIRCLHEVIEKRMANKASPGAAFSASQG